MAKYKVNEKKYEVHIVKERTFYEILVSIINELYIPMIEYHQRYIDDRKHVENYMKKNAVFNLVKADMDALMFAIRTIAREANIDNDKGLDAVEKFIEAWQKLIKDENIDILVENLEEVLKNKENEDDSCS